MYGDFTVKHFHEKVVKQHGYRLGYTTTCLGLHRSGRVQPAKGTASSFRGLAETFCAKGLFCSLYTDRGSHYFHTPEAGGKVSKIQLTQVGRALRDLGIEHIPAYSPEARDAPSGSSESSRTASSTNSRSPASPASALPTASSPRSISPSTTSASP